MIKIFEVPAGRFRINVSADLASRHMAGYDIDRIELMGLRDKCVRLMPMSRADLNAVAPFQQHNGEPLWPQVHQRGTPTSYYHQPRIHDGGKSNKFAGYVIFLWPVPATNWRLKVTYTKTEVVRGPHGWFESVRVEG